ncbi:unnamed protein product [Owenia fusiformis]|uniref:Rho GDP-dissociation inhibitor 3 n=1 Tax=Owenia fusiformis TaxID=6347 RepID=A0A8J1UKM8_OWEFU|nr:unnamed protein product [Owenia fusiformis]
MAEKDDLDIETPGYVPPKQVTMNEMLEKDKDDKSLEDYKKKLLGDAASGEKVIFFPEDPRKVIVTKLSFCTEGRPDVDLDLTKDIETLKKQRVTIKEGVTFKLKVHFFVQREIVMGLRYVHKTCRKGVQVDKTNYMVGAYAPREEEHIYSTPTDEAPSGMLARGEYTVKSLFTDDDKNEHLKWEWAFKIAKDWND